jgi:hypothetical protein
MELFPHAYNKLQTSQDVQAANCSIMELVWQHAHLEHSLSTTLIVDLVILAVLLAHWSQQIAQSVQVQDYFSKTPVFSLAQQ